MGDFQKRRIFVLSGCYAPAQTLRGQAPFKGKLKRRLIFLCYAFSERRIRTQELLKVEYPVNQSRPVSVWDFAHC